MKFLEKVKNMFTEEVEEEIKPRDEVKIEQIVPEPKKEIKALEDFNHIKETEIKKEEKKPIFFTDDDFNDIDNYLQKDEQTKKVEENLTTIEPKVKEEENIEKGIYSNAYTPTKSANDYLAKYKETEPKEPYQGNTNSEKKTPKFKPTPIISPVYGILDKNYHKEDIIDKPKPEYKSVDGLSVDTIREKAYGTLEDELENTLFGSNSILFNEKDKTPKVSKLDKEIDFFDDLEDETMPSDDDSLRDLENITMDIGKELDNLLNKENTKKDDFDISKLDDDDDLFNLIDTMYDGDDDYDN